MYALFPQSCPPYHRLLIPPLLRFTLDFSTRKGEGDQDRDEQARDAFLTVLSLATTLTKQPSGIVFSP
jgi:hypothetical protein